MKSIRAYLQGGLGNQCFIYATARALALRTQAELCLNLDYFLDDAVYRRKFELDRYRVAGTIDGTHGKVVRFLRSARYHLMAKMRKDGLGNYRCDYYPYTYRPLPEQWDGTLTLDGYWQSERYFYDQRLAILNDFQLKDSAAIDRDEMANRIAQSACPVFVHMRSYKEVPQGKGARPVTSAFYQDALSALKSKLSTAPTLFLFSDDLEWAQARLKEIPSADGLKVVPVHPAADTALPGHIRDFELLRRCHHGIVANSSFSRFAAWLGEQKNLAEGRQPIYVHNSRKKNGACPERWIRIERE